MSKRNRYVQLIEKIFEKYYTKDASEVPFKREDLVETAKELGIRLPKNLGDVIYSFRYRAELPESIQKCAPRGLEWIIRPMGQAQYKFTLSSSPKITPNPLLSETKIPDATPRIIAVLKVSKSA